MSLGATLEVGYGSGIVFNGGNFALQGTVKWRFAKLGPLDAGLRFDLGYNLGFAPYYWYYTGVNHYGVNHGLALNAAFLLHYQIIKNLSVEPYIALPIRLGFSPYVSGSVGVILGAAVEYQIIPNLKLFARTGLGGGAVFIGPYAAGTFMFEFIIGAGYQF